jgi:V/A-type H+-transporting ATPase subunit F
MKMYLISDNVDTLTGMRLVGIDGKVVHTQEELKRELDEVMNDGDIGILLIIERLAKQFPETIKEIRLNRPLPLIVEMPDRHGMGRPSDFITAYVREAIGVKL